LLFDGVLQRSTIEAAFAGYRMKKGLCKVRNFLIGLRKRGQ
jgi:hypothetical protein